MGFAILCSLAVLALLHIPVSEASGYCSTLFGYYPHSTDCTKFFRCVWGSPVEFDCPAGTRWSQHILTCDHAYNVPCYSGVAYSSEYKVYGHGNGYGNSYESGYGYGHGNNYGYGVDSSSGYGAAGYEKSSYTGYGASGHSSYVKASDYGNYGNYGKAHSGYGNYGANSGYGNYGANSGYGNYGHGYVSSVSAGYPSHGSYSSGGYGNVVSSSSDYRGGK